MYVYVIFIFVIFNHSSRFFMIYTYPKSEYQANIFTGTVKISTDSMLNQYTSYFSECLRKKQNLPYTNSKDWENQLDPDVGLNIPNI